MYKNPPASSPSTDTQRIWQRLLIGIGLISIIIMGLMESGYHHFDHRAIGISALKNVDPGYRQNLYILSIIAVMAFATSFFIRNSEKHLDSTRKQTYSLVTLLLAIALCNFAIFPLVNKAEIFLNTALLSLVIAVMLALSQRLLQQPDQERVFFALFCTCWQGSTLIFMFMGEAPKLPFWLLWIVGFILLLGGLSQNSIRNFARSNQFLVSSIIKVVVFSPLLFIAAREFEYFALIRGLNGIHAPLIFFGLIIITTFTLVSKRDKTWPNVFILGIATLITNTVLTEYSATIEYQVYDIFHLGEKVIPLQQWTSYKLLPFIDYQPGHGLFDALPHGLYYFLSGSSAMESIIWGNGYFIGWVMRAIAIAALYTLICKRIPPIASFFILWLLPTHHILNPYYTILLLPAIHISNYGKYTATKWWSIQWLLSAAILLWRLDFGIIMTVSNIVIALLISWQFWRLSDMLKSLLIGALCLAMVLLVFILLIGGIDDSLSTLKIIKTYVAIQIPIASHAEFFHSVNYPFLMQHIFLPGSTVLIASYCLGRVFNRTGNDQQFITNMLLIFLCSLTLIISLRSLHRHSLIEGVFKNHLYLLVILLFISTRSLKKKTLPIAICIFVMGSYIALPKTTNWFYNASYNITPASEYPITAIPKELPSWDNNQLRLVDTVTRYDNFIEFMGKALKPGETFYDFANAPLLYALTDVELPVYITETVYQSSETLQKSTLLELKNLRKERKLPFIVFRQNNRLDSLDDVDNALRSYHIAEFLYKNYRPCVQIDKLDIWIDRRLSSKGNCKQQLTRSINPEPELVSSMTELPMNYLKQTIDFGHVPYLWSNYDREVETITSSLLLEVSQHQQVLIENKTGQLCSPSHCYLNLIIHSEKAQQLELVTESKNLLSFAVLPGENSYRIRISSLWFWFRHRNISRIFINSQFKIEVSRAELVSVKAP